MMKNSKYFLLAATKAAASGFPIQQFPYEILMFNPAQG